MMTPTSPGRIRILSLFVSLILLPIITMVDHNNFKTCEQSAFCRRHRKMQDGESKVTLVTNSVAQDGLSVTARLHEPASGKELQMTLSSVLKDESVLRFYVNEINPVRHRFEAKDSLLDNIQYNKVTLTQTSNTGFTATFGTNKVVVNASPFRIDVFRGETLIISGNQRGLFKFEHSREKTDQEPTDDGQWEEKFKEHTDSKPYGPMSVGMDFSFIDADHLYGIPEHADSLSLKNTKGVSDPYRLYNLDVFEYELNSPMALYGSIPMVVAHSTLGTSGLVWFNPTETWIDIQSHSLSASSGIWGSLAGDADKSARSTHWISETGVIDVWFLTGPTPQDVTAQNAGLFGTTPLPPYYSIGYHQCRWNYYSQEEVEEVDQKFDDYDIPMDAIWLDIEYTDQRSKKYFTWDKVTFPDHLGMINNLTSKGRRLIAIIDPHIKRDSNYPVYNEGIELKHFIKNKDGSAYDGWCWPGSSSWPDFFDPKVRDWWADKFDPGYFPGQKGALVDIWNDMNEPSVFNGPEITAPKDLIHHEGWEHRDVHNAYGFMMTKSTHLGLSKHRHNLRPFILTRAFFPGSQRYAAAWTGDNMSKFEHLKASIPMLLSLGMTGMTFSGADVPGFFYNTEPELFVRWYQAGIFQPFFRAHAHIDTKRREPWLFGEENTKLVRDAIRIRYSYLPYMYTAFHEASVTGVPVIRPLWFHFPQDMHSFAIDDAFMWGDSILVHPITEKGISTLDIYFPGTHDDQWFDFASGNLYNGGSVTNIPVSMETIPFFQRVGTIVAKRERMRRAAALTLDDPMSLDIILAEDGSAKGKLYFDDGYTYDYTKGEYIEAEITFSHGHLKYRVIGGHYKSDIWLERVYIKKMNWKPTKVKAVDAAGSSKVLEFKLVDEDSMIIRKPEMKMTHDWTINIG